MDRVAQGIDVILRQAWDNGIVLGGASAGSLCWFEVGRPLVRAEASRWRRMGPPPIRLANRPSATALLMLSPRGDTD